LRARVRDIVIHDGSSCALKAALRTTFPGRFTAMTPAAVDVQATLTDGLLLADRGDPSVADFAAVRTQGASSSSV
jgi:hypothetical protein